MKLPEDALRLSLYFGEDDRLGGRSLAEALVQEARAQGLAGATVYRGVLGYGANSRIKSAKILMLSEDLPLVLEIIDAPGKIEAFLPWLEEHLGEGLATVEPVRVLFYRPKGGKR